jgi:hypothetical protein
VDQDPFLQGQARPGSETRRRAELGAARFAEIGAVTDEPGSGPPDIAERALGHAIAGVEGVYDRHFYSDEKADALNRLAALVETIINPPSDNVLPLPTRR